MLKKYSWIFCCLLLVGCWDERQYKDLLVLPIVGHDGHIGEITSYFSIPLVIDEKSTSQIIEGKGISIRESRMNANQKINQTLDISKLTVIFLSDEIAKDDVYDYLDVYYRNARNRLSTYIAITDGSTKKYIELGNELQGDAGAYYQQFVKSLAVASILPETDLQIVCTQLFDDGIDVIIPFIGTSEDEKPEIKGVALFNGKSFTGEYLNVKESILLSVLKKNIGRMARFTYLFDGKPLTVNIEGVKKKWDFKKLESSGVVKLTYKISLDVQEFPHNKLASEKTRKEVEKFVSEQIKQDTVDLLLKLQKAKSDPIGIGQQVYELFTLRFGIRAIGMTRLVL